MQPRPYIAIQAFMLMLAFASLTLIGAAEAVFLLSSATVIAASALTLAYRLRLRQAGDRPEERSRLDQFVVALWLVATLVPLGFAVAFKLGEYDALNPGTLGDVVIAATSVSMTAIFVSSLVDWYWILPRIRGLIRPAPWTSPDDPIWSTLTRVWLLHRAMTTLVVSAATIAVPVCMWFVSTGATRDAWLAVAIVLAAALAPLNESLKFVIHLPVKVGETVLLDDGPAYIVDVSLQGAKFKLLDDSLEFPLVSSDGLIPLDDLAKYPRLSEVHSVRLERFGALEKTISKQSHAGVRDHIDRLLGDEEMGRQEEIARRDRRTIAELAAAVGGAVAGVAAAAAQVAASIDHRGFLYVAIPTAALMVAGLVRAAVVVGRRQVRNRERRPQVEIDVGLASLGQAVERQRRALHAEQLAHDRGALSNGGS